MVAGHVGSVLMRKIAFRADASKQIGTGHFMRCLSLADELKKQGAQICFLSRNLPLHLSDMLNARGMEYRPLKLCATPQAANKLSYSNWLDISQIQDAHESIKVLANQFWDWIVVDHYALDRRWESAVRPCANRVMVIDDLADRAHDCDVLLDQNYSEDMHVRYDSKVPKSCQNLLGPRYALLRNEFSALHNETMVRSGDVRRVLVFFGGVDAKNYTTSAIAALTLLNRSLSVDVVIGQDHPNLNQVMADCANHGFECHVQTEFIARLMSQADIAIGGGGTATWERCCLGLPTIVFCMADNQRKLISEAAELGLLFAPLTTSNLVQSIKMHMHSLMDMPSLLRRTSLAGMSLVDGKGAQRVVNAMEIGEINIRKATPEDVNNIFEWRNHPRIRASSINQDIILWCDHLKWFEKMLAERDSQLLIGELNNRPIGVVRFDIQEGLAEVSIYLVPDDHSNGCGRGLMLSAETWLKSNHQKIKKIKAGVLVDNQKSISLFQDCGYQPEMNFYQKAL